MRLISIPEAVIDWATLPEVAVQGTTGTAKMRIQRAGDIQLRQVEYSPGYLADHWCSKGHIIYVVDGRLIIEHDNGEPASSLATGMTWQVSDDEGPAHRVWCENGATVFIVD